MKTFVRVMNVTGKNNKKAERLSLGLENEISAKVNLTLYNYTTNSGKLSK